MTNRNLVVTAGGTVAVAALVLGGASAVQTDRAGVIDVPDAGSPPEVTTPAESPTVSESVPDLPTGYVRFQDEQARIAVGYPQTWTRLQAEDPSVRLLATPDAQTSLLLRVTSLDQEVAPDDDEAMRTIAQEIVDGEGIELIDDPVAVNLDGVPGYRYIYSFADASSAERGIHVHFFLFDGDRLISLVLQALPQEEFPEVAGTFDQIVATLQLLD